MKQLKCTYSVYKHSKPLDVPQIVITRDLTPPVSVPSINKMLEEIDKEARKLIQEKYDAYPVLYSYNPVETDEIKPCYCFTCKKRFDSKRIYGVLLDSPKCPQGHSKTTDKSWGKCYECNKGLCWETKVKRGGPELMVHSYKCDTCGATGAEPID